MNSLKEKHTRLCLGNQTSVIPALWVIVNMTLYSLIIINMVRLLNLSGCIMVKNVNGGVDGFCSCSRTYDDESMRCPLVWSLLCYLVRDRDLPN